MSAGFELLDSRKTMLLRPRNLFSSRERTAVVWLYKSPQSLPELTNKGLGDPERDFGFVRGSIPNQSNIKRFQGP